MSFIIASASVYASDVFIETDMEFGRGMLRAVGNECLVYTPKHVVEDSDGIYVSGRFKRDIEANLLTTYPQDLAVLSIPKSDIALCQESSWKDGGARVSAILNSIGKAKLSFRKKNGGLTEYDLKIVAKEIHTYFHVKLENPKKSFKQGLSGSTIYVGNYPVGMLISINDDIGKVLRLDDITNISQSVISTFETELEKISRENGLVTKKISPNNETTSLPLTNRKEQIFKGEITKGAVQKFKILATGNTAYKLTNLKQNGNNVIGYSFYSPNDSEKLSAENRIRVNKNSVFGFGTTVAGEHTLYISGYRGVGSFNLKLEEVATTEELVGKANILASGDNAKGFISKGTFATYKVHAKGNTAYKLTNLKQNGNNLIGYSFYSPNDSEKLSAENRISVNKNSVFGFGTTVAGEHTLYIYGYRGVGSFNLKLEEVATTEELVGKANILASGDNAKGFISKGTFAIYKVHAKGNTAYKLTNLKQNGNNLIGYSFYSPNDSEKLSGKNRINVNKNSVFGFGTTVAGEHTLYIYGNRGVGSFNLKLEEVSN